MPTSVPGGEALPLPESPLETVTAIATALDACKTGDLRALPADVVPDTAGRQVRQGDMDANISVGAVHRDWRKHFLTGAGGIRVAEVVKEIHG